MPEAELVVDVPPLHRKLYFHVSELRKMKRTVLTLTDPKTKNVIQYEGVTLEDLLASASIPPQGGTTEICYGFFHKRKIRNTDLEPQSELVADKVNGRPLTFDKFFLFVANTRTSGVVIIRNVVTIREKAAV